MTKAFYDLHQIFSVSRPHGDCFEICNYRGHPEAWRSCPAGAAGTRSKPGSGLVPDLEEVWRAYYQDKLRKSAYRVREQASDSDVATAALTRFASWLHESGDPKPSVKDTLQALLNRMD